MGRINRFVCPSCNASWQIALGHGIGHAVLEDVLELFPAEIRRNILCDTAGKQISSFEFNISAKRWCPFRLFIFL